MRKFITLFSCLWVGGLLLATEQPPTTEDQKIDTLLGHVAQQPDVQFVRNDKSYDTATAVKFLRAKWDRQRAEIKTVRDFIDKVATRSSTTGQPYLIRFKDNRTIECRDFLTGLLTTP